MNKIEKFLKEAPKLMVPINGWTMFVESSGGWCWSYKDSEIAIYASPFWDDLAGIPLEFCYDEFAEASVSAFIPFELTGDLEKDVTEYLAKLIPYFALRPNHQAFKDAPSIQAVPSSS